VVRLRDGLVESDTRTDRIFDNGAQEPEVGGFFPGSPDGHFPPRLQAEYDPR
jgi:hypothetical protein